MKHRLRNLLILASLGLCIFASVMAYRCTRAWDVVSWQRPGGIGDAAVSARGELILIRARLSKSDAPVGLLWRTDNNGALGDKDNHSWAKRIGFRATPPRAPRQRGKRGVWR